MLARIIFLSNYLPTNSLLVTYLVTYLLQRNPIKIFHNTGTLKKNADKRLNQESQDLKTCPTSWQLNSLEDSVFLRSVYEIGEVSLSLVEFRWVPSGIRDELESLYFVISLEFILSYRFRDWISMADNNLASDLSNQSVVNENKSKIEIEQELLRKTIDELEPLLAEHKINQLHSRVKEEIAKARNGNWADLRSKLNEMVQKLIIHSCFYCSLTCFFSCSHRILMKLTCNSLLKIL